MTSGLESRLGECPRIQHGGPRRAPSTPPRFSCRARRRRWDGLTLAWSRPAPLCEHRLTAPQLSVRYMNRAVLVCRARLVRQISHARIYLPPPLPHLRACAAALGSSTSLLPTPPRRRSPRASPEEDERGWSSLPAPAPPTPPLYCWLSLRPRGWSTAAVIAADVDGE